MQSSSPLFLKNIQCRICDQNNVGWVDNKLKSTLIVILGTKLVARLALDLLHKPCIWWCERFGNGNGVEFIFHRFIIFDTYVMHLKHISICISMMKIFIDFHIHVLNTQNPCEKTTNPWEKKIHIFSFTKSWNAKFVM